MINSKEKEISVLDYSKFREANLFVLTNLSVKGMK
jgi:hypothetical protein